MVLQLSFNFYLFVSFLLKNFKKQLGFIVSLRSLERLLKVVFFNDIHDSHAFIVNVK